MKKICLIAITFLALIITSCSDSDNDDIDFITAEQLTGTVWKCIELPNIEGWENDEYISLVFESTTRASTYLNQMGDVPGGQDNHFFRATYTVIDNQLTFYIDSEVGNSVYPGIIDGNKITIIYKTGFEFVFKKQ